MLEDIRYALRTLAKNKGFAAAALFAMALGIGTTTAVFSVVNRTILRPLPFAAQDRLVQLYGIPAERGEALAAVDVEEFRRSATSFEVLAGYNVGARYLQNADGLERVMTVDVQRDFFSLLGVEATAGRTFHQNDLSNVAVASESFWRRRFGGSTAALGSVLTLNGSAFSVVGVMPDSFQFPYGAASLLQGVAAQSRTDLWILQDSAPGQPPRGRLSLVTGRLKKNVSPATAQSELAVIMKRLESQSPDRTKGLGVRIVPLSEAVISRPIRRSLFIMFGAASLVLLLACANVTNVLLMRSMLRRSEVATRIAVGASPIRLVRQFLTESLLISIGGGIAGLWLAWWGAGELTRIAAAHIPRLNEAGIDWRVFELSVGLCVVSGLLFGLAQLFNVIRPGPHSVLREAGTRHTMGLRQRRLRDCLVAGEVALALVLGTGATLLIRELVRLSNTNTGMVTENVISIHVGQPLAAVTDPRQFYEIVERVRQVPGVREAGFTQMLPLQNWGWSGNSADFPARGRTAPDGSPYSMELRYVTPRYFQTLGIPIKRGRNFTDQDDRNAPRVILINETLARKAFGSHDPVGQTTSRGIVIGIVGDVRQVHLDRPASPEVYYPIAQNWSQVGELGMSLLVRTERGPLPLAEAIRSRIREVNPNLAIFDIKTMDQVLAESMSDFLVYLAIISVFASAALFLAVTGTYGVISYIAASRTHEFAIRAALGAARGSLQWLVLVDAIRLTAIGLASGFAIVLAARPLLQNLPVTIRPPDAATLAPIMILIGAAAVAACLVPARRAAAADPMSILREE